MRIDVVTLFPGSFVSPLGQSILKRAQEKKIVEIKIHNLRDYAVDKHHITDDRPYGGGPGMVLKPEPVFRVVEAILSARSHQQVEHKQIILPSPQGKVFNQEKAKELAKCPWLIFICGHYEGVDERVRQELITDEISIGDYVLTGGEIPTLVIIDAVVRLLPGVVGNADSVKEESFTQGMLDWPQYTRPRNFRGWEVPEVLLCGNHQEIARWRREQAKQRTLIKKPELLK